MNRTFLQTLMLTILAIAALFAIDTFLAKTERAEEQAEAARQFAEGQRQLNQGRYSDAIEQLSSAVSLQRENRQYRLGLADAYLAASRFSDAHSTLDQLVQDDSTDGATNLTMARVLLKQGQPSEAVSFYHRAIYGHWADTSMTNHVRFELADLLVRQGAQSELLAELLPLQEQPSEDLEERIRLGRLFLAAGSSPHAIEVFQDVLRHHPQNADATVGLGDAEAAHGNYRAAHANFFIASRLNPQDQMIRGKLEMANEVLALDPTERGLDSRERYRRSLKLLDAALQGSASCVTGDISDRAMRAFRARIPVNAQSGATEENIDLAEQLWQTRRSRCPRQEGTSESAWEIVLGKLSQ